MTEKHGQQASGDTKITRQSRFSAIWLVPILALMFGGWLAYKATSERGTFITIEFESAAGIVPEKTEVRYKGLTAGLVKSVELTDDFDKVLVTVEIKSLDKSLLTDEAKFWYVTANVSIDGVSGLDTLLSGSYISILPDIAGKGEPEDFYVALKEPPSLSESTPGLHIQLITKELNSIRPNTKIRYKQLVVGYVTNYQYEKASDQIVVNAFVEPEYAHLVKENTRFWNSSGINFTASVAAGVKLRTGSVDSILSGGISFDTLPYLEEKPAAQNSRNFNLYPDFDTAQTGHEIDLYFHWDTGYLDGAFIMFQGIVAGRVTELVDIDAERRIIHAKALVDPRAKQYLTEHSQFYVVSPKVSLSGIKNITTALSGSHLGFMPSFKGEAKTAFNVLPEKPPFTHDEPGLHLELEVEDLDSLNLNSAIYYQKETVGSIQNISYLPEGGAKLQIHILPRYAHLVNSNSRFWNTSGIRLAGNLQGFEVQTDAFASILSGGIAFATIPSNKRASSQKPSNKSKSGNSQTTAINNGDQFKLFGNANQAQQSTRITLYTSAAQQIKPGTTKVFYQGVAVGSVHKMNFQHKKQLAELSVGLHPEFDYLLKQGTRFWLTTPSLSLAGLSDPQALLAGAYISFKAGGGKKRSSFTLSDTPPRINTRESGLQLVLESDNASSLIPGSPISYKNIRVGQIDSYRLADNGRNVIVNATITEKYRHLINGHSRFYNASGISISGDLSGIEVSTASVDSILKGGISFYNPESNQTLASAAEGTTFTLYEGRSLAKTAGLAITIDFEGASGLSKGSKIKYRQQVIGQVTRLEFDKRMQRVKVYALLSDQGRQLAVHGSQFWIAEPRLGLTGTANLDALLSTYINILPGRGDGRTEFIGSNSEPVVNALNYGLNVMLVAQSLGSVKVGDPLLYKQVKVGKVIGVDLSPQADSVLIYVNVRDKYAPLVQPNSKFWNVSGIKVEAGLFSGVNIKTESVESILAGGIAFATPNTRKVSTRKIESYQLHQEPDDDWIEWNPSVKLNN